MRLLRVLIPFFSVVLFRKWKHCWPSTVVITPCCCFLPTDELQSHGIRCGAEFIRPSVSRGFAGKTRPPPRENTRASKEEVTSLELFAWILLREILKCFFLSKLLYKTSNDAHLIPLAYSLPCRIAIQRVLDECNARLAVLLVNEQKYVPSCLVPSLFPFQDARCFFLRSKLRDEAMFRQLVYAYGTFFQPFSLPCAK